MTGISGQIHQPQIRRDGLGAEYQGQAESGQIYSGVSASMHRVYQSTVVALVGLMLAGAQPITEKPHASTGTQQAGGPQETAPAPAPTSQAAYRPYAQLYSDACYGAKDHDAADLCAQWRAALAAEKTAREARFATIAAIFGTALSIITIIGLIVAIWQTHGALAEARRGNRINLRLERRARRESREAAIAQERALNIAGNQFKLSEKSAKTQLRSYLVVDRIEPFQVNGPTLSVKIFIKNVGQTPAKIGDVSAKIWLSENISIDPFVDGPPRESFYHIVNVLAQGGEDSILTACDQPDVIPKLNETDKADVYVYGRIDFTDVFDDPHWITFAYSPVIWGFERTTKFRACINGNDSQ